MVLFIHVFDLSTNIYEELLIINMTNSPRKITEKAFQLRHHQRICADSSQTISSYRYEMKTADITDH